MELGLGPCLKTKVVFLSMANHLLYYRAQLVDLYWVDDETLSVVSIFLGSIVETSSRLFDAIVDNVGEADEQWGCNVA